VNYIRENTGKTRLPGDSPELGIVGEIAYPLPGQEGESGPEAADPAAAFPEGERGPNVVR
jgi:hypothetical protein